MDCAAEMPPRACPELEWQGLTAFFALTGYTGEDGGIVGAEHASTLWDALLAAGIQ